MIRFLAALLLLLLGSIGTVSAQPSGCTTTTCTGSALSSGFLSVSGNQFVNGLGQTQRLACTEFKGKPTDSMVPIRNAGFNCIRIDWHDAYLGTAATPTFTDPFTSLSLHQTWQSGDLWEIGASFDNGIGQGGPFLGDFGSQWWVNPFNPNTAFGSCGSNCYAGGLYQISPSGTLELGLSNIPSSMQAYINTTSQCNGTCSGAGGNLSYLGAIVNNQNLNTQQFGDYRLTVAVDKLAGADFQWDIESYNQSTNFNNPPEIDLGIYTDASNIMHTYLQIDGGSRLFDQTSPTFDPSVPHNYELNWQSDFITFYVDGVQQGQVATSSQPAVYSSGNPMFSYLLSGANYRSGTNPTTNAATLAAWHAHVSAFSVYQNRPSGSGGSGGIANGLGCNTLTDIATCVANANAAGLKVVFSHRGNEVPTGPCVTRQANGLWFDSGPDSGGNDGCIAGAGNYTFGQFQTDTANLLGAYAGNSTVIGYEMHHQPLVVGTYTGTGGGVVMKQGAFISSGTQAGVNSQVNGFTSNIGPLTEVESFLVDTVSWPNMLTASTPLPFYAAAVSAGAVPLVSMPMASTVDDTSGPVAALNAITAGTRDAAITSFISAYKNQGWTTIILRPGWEMNLPTGSGGWPWSVGGATAGAGPTAAAASAFRSAWQHIYTLVKAIPGITVTFDWTPSAGWSVGSGSTSLYPGDAYVDYIGVDAYDNVATNDANYGMIAAATMSVAHGKHFSFGEIAPNTNNVSAWAPWMSSTQSALAGVSGLIVDHFNLMLFDPTFGGDPIDNFNQPAITAIKNTLSAVAAQTATNSSGGGGGTGAFTVSGGNMIAPDGSVFHAFGINIDWSASSVSQVGAPPTVATVQAAIPKLNHIRLAIGADGGGYQDSPSFSSLESYVNSFTAKGIVVMIESHYTGQPSACSVDLAGEAAWYSRLATDLKSNNLVMFESGNELSGANTGGGCLTQEHQNVYNAIRGTGNNTVIALTTSDGNDFAHGGAPETPSAYSSMSNIVWGQHYYNWMTNDDLGFPGLNNQTNVNANLAHQVVLGQNFATSASGSIPTLVTEGGYLDYARVCGGLVNGGQGNQIYNCGEGQVVQAFLTPTASNVVGGDFWLWFFTGCGASGAGCDQTNVVTAQGGSANTFYGNTVNGIINSNSPGPNTFSGSGGGGGSTSSIPQVNWGGGGPTDVLAACKTIGAAVAAVNPGVIEFCPGPANNSTGTTLLSGATKPAGGGGGLSDLSAAVAHPLTGLPAGKAAYSIDIYPTNLGGVTPDSPIGTTVPIWNAYFGNAAASVPVMDMETGCSCDGTNGNLTDDNAMMTAWTSYANGSASGGPRFTTGQQPISNTWLSWGYAPGVNPDGTLNSDLTTLKLGQQTWWSTLLFGSAGPPPPPSPTTWNPSDKSASIALSNNNLTATTSGGVGSVRTNNSKSSGKVCFDILMTTGGINWAVGLADSTFALGSAAGSDTHAIVFVPAESQDFYFGGTQISGPGTGSSANGETATICADLTAHLFWASSQTMRSGGNNWNNSNTANPATGTGGFSFSGMLSPVFIVFNEQDPTGVAVLNTTGPFAVSTPAGFSPWDNTTVTGRPSLMLILGSNDNHPGGIKLASNY